jgi:hypothetical protein
VMRDPRFEPKLGDVIESDQCSTYEVTGIIGGYAPGGYVYFRRHVDSREDPFQIAHVPIAVWRRKAAKCSIIHVGG